MRPVVATKHGKVRGFVTNDVMVFRGIPYAGPPVGAERFRAPQPVQPWDGVREASRCPPTAPAPTYPEVMQHIFGELRVAGDDYLNLTVWTPDLGASRLPVVVWIHGGAFTHGSSAHPRYDAQAFAHDGIVTVTINYRLGVEGFSALDGAPNNRGVLDQIAALHWVRENVAAFGGDPDQVTVAGQSAGAMSVCTLMAMPAARGLFRRGIAQSGAAHTVMQMEDARIVGRAIADYLGCDPTADAVASMPLERVLQVQQQIADELRTRGRIEVYGERLLRQGLGFCPVVDGDSLPERPIDAIRHGAGADIDLLIGTTAEEYRLFLVPGGAIDLITEQLLEVVRCRFGLPADATAAYAREHELQTPGDILCAMVSDRGFRMPACRVMEARETSPGRTYAYRFDWRSPLLGGRLGACHSVDVPFVFKTIPLGARAGEEVRPQGLANEVHGAWSRFVTTGDPGWAVWDSETRSTMRFDAPSSKVVHDPKAVTRRLWDGLL